MHVFKDYVLNLRKNVIFETEMYETLIVNLLSDLKKMETPKYSERFLISQKNLL